jgi:hypothetical protein
MRNHGLRQKQGRFKILCETIISYAVKYFTTERSEGTEEKENKMRNVCGGSVNPKILAHVSAFSEIPIRKKIFGIFLTKWT